MADKKRVLLSVIFSFILVFISGTYAYWSWKGTEGQKTSIEFTATAEFACSVDGKGTLEWTSSDVVMAPSSCTNSKHVIKKEIDVSAEIFDADLSAYMDLWLEVKYLAPELSESQNFRYAMTTSPDGCNAGTVMASGSFNGKQIGDRVSILGHQFAETGATKYYLYIWLDSAETNPNTAGKTFQLQLGGKCSNAFQPEAPALDSTGLIPIVFKGINAYTISSNDSTWYNYANKQWANAVLVTSSSRSKYHGTNNKYISTSDILAYYVWIPRYKYKIWTTGVSSAGNEQIIDIMFERKNTAFSSGTTVDSYKTHPAFWWDSDSDSVMDDDEKLAGIWVGKFETTGTAAQPTIKEQTTSIKNQIILGQFTSSLIFSGGTFNSSTGKVTHQYNDTYGLDGSVDSHMMKNSEWGAVAYLSQSIYGIGEQLVGAIGCGISATANCIFNSSNGAKISTTDNLTGVYDMGNGTSERVMAVYGQSSAFSYFGKQPDRKYYDIYFSSCGIQNCGGHALNETAGWYSGSSISFNSNIPWHIRGSSGSQFSYSNNASTATGSAWRSVLVNVPSYIISYAANGGTGAPDNFRKMSGEDTVLSSVIPTREGYSFVGWNTEADGSGTSYASGATYKENVGVTLYAQWKDETAPIVTISSTTNDVASSQTVLFNVEDSIGVVGYYVGTSNPNTENVSWTSIENVTSKDLSANVNSGVTWYFAARDKDGNIGVKNIVFYQTSLVASDVNISVSEVVTMSGNSFTLPIPTGSSKFTFVGWYTSLDYSGDAITTYTPTANGSVYAKVDGQPMVGGVVTIAGKNMVGETLTANVTEVPNPTPESYTYQWYSNTTNSTTGGTKLIGATYNTYKVSNALINKYIYVVVTAKHNDYLDVIMTDITDSTNNHSSYADLNPVVKINSTENINSTTQVATLQCTDNNGVVGYYFGTESNPTTYTSIDSTKNMSLTSQVSAVDTYYLFCKDENDNVTSNSITYYGYRVHNMLETVATTSLTHNDVNYEEVSVSPLYLMRSVLNTTSIGSAPVGSNLKRLSGFSENSNPTALKSVGTAIKLSGETDLYFWFTRLRTFIRYNVNDGLLTYSTTDGVNTYSWGGWGNGDVALSGNVDFYSLKYGAGIVENALLDHNNSQYLKISRTGYSAISGAEWKCMSGCTVENQTYDQSGSYSPDDFCSMTNDDCTVTLGVNWKANTYNVNYKPNGGVGTMEPTSCTYDELCTLADSQFTRVGYTQTGWNTRTDGNGSTYKFNHTFSYVSSSSMTLYAMWQANTYTISYDANGGDGTMATSTCTYGKSCTLSTNSFTRSGYNFLGWSTDADATAIEYGNNYNFNSFNIANDIKLYAIWERKPIITYFNVNGGQIDSSGMNFSVDTDGFVKLDDNYVNNTWKETTNSNLANYNNSSYIFITKTGYSAKSGYEWNTKADGSGTSYDQNADYLYSAFLAAAVEEDTYYRLDLYVNWEPKKYTVGYDPNGGVGVPDDQIKTYGQTLTLSSVTPTRENYTFLGWYPEDSEATSAIYSAGGVYTENEDVTLYAVWRPNQVLISFNVNGGNYTETTTKWDGSLVYNWTTDEDGTLSVNGNSVIDTISYNSSLTSDGLANWNNPNYIELTHENSLVPKTGEEWICINGCTTLGRTYDQTDVTYTTDDFCDVTNGDCTVELAANWVDEIAPTCTVSVSNTGVTLSNKTDNVGVTEFGMGSSSTHNYDGTEFRNLSIGTTYGYVRDEAGNTGTCSVLLLYSTSSTTDTTINCSASNFDNRTTTACANAGYTGYRGSNSCAKSETFRGSTYQCSKVFNGTCYCNVNGTAVAPPSDDGFEWNTLASCQDICTRTEEVSGVHSKSFNYELSYLTNFGGLTADYCTIGNTGNNMIAENACSSSTVDRYYRDCTSNGVNYSGTISCYNTTYTCDAGFTLLPNANQWCYK